MKTCTICVHPRRVEIENALFKMVPENATLTLEKIAEEYGVAEEDLRAHALFHTSFNFEPNGDSIVRQIKMREADMLGAAAMEYMATMQVVGKRIRKFAQEAAAADDDVRFEKCLTKPVADLFIGCGDGLKGAIKALADINQQLNGPKDDGTSGLTALAEAIRASRNRGDVE